MSREVEDTILEKGMQRDTNCAVILDIVQKGGGWCQTHGKKKLQFRKGLLAKNWHKIALLTMYNAVERLLSFGYSQAIIKQT